MVLASRCKSSYYWIIYWFHCDKRLLNIVILWYCSVVLFVPGFKDCITVKRCNFLNLSHCFLVYLVKLAGNSDSTGLVPVQRSCASVVNTPAAILVICCRPFFYYFHTFCFEYDFDRNPVYILHRTFKCENYFENYDLPQRLKS